MSKIQELIDIDNNDDETLYKVSIATAKPHTLATVVDDVLSAVHATQGITKEQDEVQPSPIPTGNLKEAVQEWELSKYTDDDIKAEYERRFPF